MAKWRGTVKVGYCFEAPDRRTAERMFENGLTQLGVNYRDPEVEEIDDKEFEKEQQDA